MRIKCIANRWQDLPDDCFDPRGGFDRNHKFALEIGKEYTVYAITLFLGYIWYYICDENYVYYPFWNPSPLFEVADGRISKYWEYNFIKGDSTRHGFKTIFAFEEWAKDPYGYYDRLTDKQETEVTIFNHYKGLMDLEFPDPFIKKKATNLSDNWVKCSDCDEAWETTSDNGMLKCPNCGTILHNPLYSYVKGKK